MTNCLNRAEDFYDDHSAARWLAELPVFPGEQVVLERLHDRGTKDLSDVGCGAGRLVSISRAFGFQYRALDPAKAQIAELLSRHPKTDAIVADGTALPWATNSTDAVLLMFHVLESVLPYSDRLAMLKEAQRVLRQDGVVVLSRHRAWRYRPVNQICHYWSKQNALTEWGDMILEGRPTTGGISVAGLSMHLISNRELKRLAKASGLQMTATLAMKRKNTFWGRILDSTLIHILEPR